MKRAEHTKGLTMIETVIGLAIAAILFSLAAPTFSEMIRNSRIRGQAETVLTALQLARSEAIRGNTRAIFMFTNATPVASVDASSTPPVAPAVTGASWVIYRLLSDLAVPRWELIDSRVGQEGSGISQTASTAGITGTGAVVFDNMGEAQFLSDAGVRSAIASVAPFTVWPAAGESACRHTAYGDAVCLRVEVAAGGSARVCDPSLSSPDSRACR